MKSVNRLLWVKGSVFFLLVTSCVPQGSNNSPDSPTAVAPSVSPSRPLASTQTGQPETSESLNTAQAESDIWAQMRQGTGYVVLLRHAQTVDGTGDPPGFQLDDCTTQRNLSETGREQAVRIGKVFRDRGIPIHQVLSSQYCRCLDTARLLNLGNVEPSPMLNSTFTNYTNEAEQTAQVRQQILNHQNTSGVLVMVSHFVNIGSISTVSPSEGGAVVVRANQQGNLEIVEQIRSF